MYTVKAYRKVDNHEQVINVNTLPEAHRLSKVMHGTGDYNAAIMTMDGTGNTVQIALENGDLVTPGTA